MHLGKGIATCHYDSFYFNNPQSKGSRFSLGSWPIWSSIFGHVGNVMYSFHNTKWALISVFKSVGYSHYIFATIAESVLQEDFSCG